MQKGSKKPASSQQNLKNPIHLLFLTNSILCSFGASSIPQPSTSTPGAFWGARSARPGCRALPVARPLCGSRDPTYWGASPTAPRPPRSGQGEWGWKMVPEQKDLVLKWGSGVWRVRNFRRTWTKKNKNFGWWWKGNATTRAVWAFMMGMPPIRVVELVSIGSSIFPTWSNWADIRKGATSSTETFIWRSSKALTWRLHQRKIRVWRLLQEPWVMTDVPMGHITQPWMVYGLLDGYFFRWCPLYSQNGTVTNPWELTVGFQTSNVWILNEVAVLWPNTSQLHCHFCSFYPCLVVS